MVLKEKYKHQRFCKDPNCKFERADRSRFRYIITAGGEKRVQLQRISANVFICPKCGLSTVTEEFVDETFELRKRQKKKEIRIAQLQLMYH